MSSRPLSIVTPTARRTLTVQEDAMASFYLDQSATFDALLRLSHELSRRIDLTR